MPLYNPASGGGGAQPYISNMLYPAMPAIGSGNITADFDSATVFAVREQVQIDGLWFSRTATTAANTYAGIYNALTGALLTDAAVSSNTTVGIKTVSITAITLLTSVPYIFLLNTSAATTIASCSPAQTDTAGLALEKFGHPPGMSDILPSGAGLRKSRTNAALLSTLTLTGFSTVSTGPFGGFIKV